MRDSEQFAATSREMSRTATGKPAAESGQNYQLRIGGTPRKSPVQPWPVLPPISGQALCPSSGYTDLCGRNDGKVSADRPSSGPKRESGLVDNQYHRPRV